MSRRDRGAIYAAILSALDAESRAAPEGDVRLTRVRSKANVPFDRLKAHIETMRERGLVERDRPVPTPAGLAFLKEYRAYLDMLERFGIVMDRDDD